MKNVISRSLLVLFLILQYSFVFSQTKSVTGIVADEAGVPLPGVTVIIKGTTNGTVTNVDGEYSLGNVPEDVTLEFSFIGMVAQEIPVVGQSTINVIMAQESIGLEEIVAVGYGTQKRVNLTGSIATVQNEDIVKVPVASTTNALAGRIPGLITKQASGAPGEDEAELFIRGYGAPLTIVDGIEQDFNDINPNEIESISVLKDAAAAIYGARAGNGVILVTTKQGQMGKPKLTFRSSYTLQGSTIYPKAMNAGQYAEVIRETQLNDESKKITYSEEDIELFYNGTDPVGHPNTNWYDEAFREWSPMKENNLTISGGSKDIQYFGFLGFLDQEGMIKTGDNKYKRYNLRMNVKTQISKDLSVSLNLSAVLGDKQRPNLWGEPFFRATYDALPTKHSAYPDPSKITYHGFGKNNPLAASDIDKSGYQRINNNVVKGILAFEYKVPAIKGLSLKALGNYMQKTVEDKKWVKQYDMWGYNFETDVYSLRRKSVSPTQLTQKFDKERTLTGQFSLNYNRTFNQAHNFKGLFLYEIIDFSGYDFSASRQNYITPAMDYLFAGGEEDQLADGEAEELGRSSLVGRINYNYSGKYFLETTMRYDGSPNFPSNIRWGFFPSVSAAWRISEEPFVKDNIPSITNLKLRASVGKAGFDKTSAYQYLSGYELSGQYAINGEIQKGLASTGLANPYITWESMTNYNLGLDVSFFNGKLYSQIDLFYRLREGMLESRILSLPNTFGADLPDENINSQDSRGFEFVLGHNGSIGDFKYSISGNVSWARTKWVHHEEPEYTDPDDIRINKKTGQWTDVYIGYVSDGLFTSQEEIDNLPFDQDTKGNKTLHPGDIKYIDINGDSIFNSKDMDVIGNGRYPLISYGLNLNASYKGFDLSLLFQGAAKFNMVLSQFDQGSLRTYPEVMYNNRWTPENNDPNALFARQSIKYKTNKHTNSSFYLKDASYLRLKNISLGYTLSTKSLNKIGVNHLRAYVSGTNLFTFSDLYKTYQLDPEALTANTLIRKSAWYYPQQKTVSIGLEIQF